MSKKYLKPKFPRDFPIKKKGYQKLVSDIKRIREVLEKEGPCEYKKIQDKTGIKRGTLGRCLEVMKELGEIARGEHRKWMFTAPMKKYENYDEYKIHLKHSKMLVAGILAINEFLPAFFPLNDFHRGDILAGQRNKLNLRPNYEMGICALQHIQTSYPDVFEVFERCKSVLEKVESINTAEQEMILERVEKESIDIHLHGVDSSLEDDKDSEPDAPSTPNEGERLKLEEEANEARFELEHRLTELILKVQNGDTLNGMCYQCPRVNINEKSEPA